MMNSHPCMFLITVLLVVAVCNAFHSLNSVPASQFQTSLKGGRSQLIHFSATSDEDEPSVLSVEQDWRELRAKLVSQGLDYGVVEQSQSPEDVFEMRWAHRLANVEVGSIILDAGGETFSENQKYFQHSVILIIRHDEQGTVGLILNQPTGYKMGDMVADANLRSLPGFEESDLYMGGDVGGRRLDGMDCINLMHDKQYVGTTKVVNGLYLGALNEALNDVKSGRAKADEFKFFTKYCGWARGQLDSEIDAGFWFVAACDVPTILDDRCTVAKDMWLEIIKRISKEA